MRKFTFHLWPPSPIEGKPGYFRCGSIDTEGETVEDAYAGAVPQVADGQRIFTWHEECNEAIAD